MSEKIKAEEKAVAAAAPHAGPLTPEAARALAEAEARRKAALTVNETAREAIAEGAMKEVAGRDGPDPVRYGDWEKGGIASDF